MNTDIMVDLETYDTSPTAVILSIGACRVNWETGVPDMPYYQVINLESSSEAGRTSSSDTIRWWDKQSAQARQVFTDPNQVPFLDGMVGFAQYLLQFGAKYGASQAKLWGNGSDFDNVIIADAYRSLNLDPPWKFYNNRCFRTFKDMHSDILMDVPRNGTHHNALDDALHQARVMLTAKPHLSARKIRGA